MVWLNGVLRDFQKIKVIFINNFDNWGANLFPYILIPMW